MILKKICTKDMLERKLNKNKCLKLKKILDIFMVI